jgi:hypothetical protein
VGSELRGPAVRRIDVESLRGRAVRRIDVESLRGSAVRRIDVESLHQVSTIGLPSVGWPLSAVGRVRSDRLR